MLAAIYNVFDGEENLERSMDYLRKEVDLFIIIYQTTNYYGEEYNPFKEMPKYFNRMGRVIVEHYDTENTDHPFTGYINQLAKRKRGLEIARKEGCTHFITMDCDEMYPDFKELKEEYLASGADASICEIETYIYKDNYRVTPPPARIVPFINDLKKDTVLGSKSQYHVDKTRSVASNNTIRMSKPMHHLTWVRNDIELKIRSAASKASRNNDYIRQDIQYLKKNGIKNFISKYYTNRTIELKSIDE